MPSIIRADPGLWCLRQLYTMRDTKILRKNQKSEEKKKRKKNKIIMVFLDFRKNKIMMQMCIRWFERKWDCGYETRGVNEYMHP